jgi:hypothetical protein
MNQKKHKRIEFDGLVCAKGPTTNEITTDQKVEQLAVSYFHAKKTKVQNSSSNPSKKK